MPVERELTPGAGLPRWRVLVADDTASNRLLLRALLERLGQEVLLACDGLEALTVFQRERPDFVLTDVEMPGASGYEVTRTVKALAADAWVPVVILTTLEAGEEMIRGLEAGADEFLKKPFVPAFLEARLKALSRTLVLHRRLAESRHRAEALMESVVDGVVTASAHGVILQANAAMERIFGWPVRELLGQSLRVLMPEPEGHAHQAQVDGYLTGGPRRIIGVGQRRLRGRRRDGEVFPLEVGVNETTIGGERVFVGLLRDVSVREATEGALQRTGEALRLALRQKETERAFALQVMERQALRAGALPANLEARVVPCDGFSGDVVAAHTAPRTGDQYVLLGDAIGHGLPAAVLTLPLLAAFHELAEQALSVGALVARLDAALAGVVPEGRFVAAAVLRYAPADDVVEAWNGGLPPPLLRRGGRVERLEARNLGLGIDATAAPTVTRLPAAGLDAVVLASDGFTERSNAQGQLFGSAGLARALETGPARVEALWHAMAQFAGEAPAHDDQTLLVWRPPGR